ncbi:hypothetical protein CDD80_5949 [Ophiocordyceps camponoti-rufipedis]|uniref:Uncharacterized protein n=1 Tax=Ophiocordyceps camponoti-rufipedis TaxID=2004952 RepID=A0A2C5XFH4_9HYPO|nr:hypothetical protein CDD80_5949 [Ophiocordyceps camponoti-rufipedis]
MLASRLPVHIVLLSLSRLCSGTPWSTMDSVEGLTGIPYASNQWSKVGLTTRGRSTPHLKFAERNSQRHSISPSLGDSDVFGPHGEGWVTSSARKGDWKATDPPRIGGYDNFKVSTEATGPVTSSDIAGLCRYPRMLMLHTLYSGKPRFRLFASKFGQKDLQISGNFSCGMVTARDVVGECVIDKTSCVTDKGHLLSRRPAMYDTTENALPFDLIPLATCHHLDQGMPSPFHNVVCSRMETHGNIKQTLVYWCMLRSLYEGQYCLWQNVRRHSWTVGAQGRAYTRRGW